MNTQTLSSYLQDRTVSNTKNILIISGIVNELKNRIRNNSIPFLSPKNITLRIDTAGSFSIALTGNAIDRSYSAPKELISPIEQAIFSLGIITSQLYTREFPSLPLSSSKIVFSPLVHNFISACLSTRNEHRPSLEDLSNHPLLCSFERLSSFVSTLHETLKGGFFTSTVNHFCHQMPSKNQDWISFLPREDLGGLNLPNDQVNTMFSLVKLVRNNLSHNAKLFSNLRPSTASCPVQGNRMKLQSPLQYFATHFPHFLINLCIFYSKVVEIVNCAIQGSRVIPPIYIFVDDSYVPKKVFHNNRVDRNTNYESRQNDRHPQAPSDPVQNSFQRKPYTPMATGNHDSSNNFKRKARKATQVPAHHQNNPIPEPPFDGNHNQIRRPTGHGQRAFMGAWSGHYLA
ncbi:hypothetical protein RCL1_002360 [Eukaryota sp. TZLM3-RCL]